MCVKKKKTESNFIIKKLPKKKCVDELFNGKKSFNLKKKEENYYNKLLQLYY